MKKIIFIISLISVLFLSACHSYSPTEEAPGFLPDYTILKKVPDSPEGTQIYTYKNPNVNRSDYHAVLITPVMIYQKANRKGVTDEQIEQVKTELNAGIQQMVSKQIGLTNTAGPGVARLEVAITGAMVEKQNPKLRNLIPVSAAIFLASKATDLDKKQPVLIVELKFTDSVSKQLLRETVTVIKGENFRMQSSSTEEFVALAKTWVQQALDYSGGK